MKKLLLICVCVIMGLTMITPGIAANDQIPIDTVSVTMQTLYVGYRDDDCHPDVSTPSHALYKCLKDYSYWLDENGQDYGSYGPTLEEGKTYRAKLCISCDINGSEGYKFDENTTFQVKNAQLERVDVRDKEADLYIRYTPAPRTPIENVSISFPTIYVGTSGEYNPKITIPSNAPYTYSSAGSNWLDENGVNTFYPHFEEGKTYYACIRLNCEYPYQFKANTTYTIKNAQFERAQIHDKYVEVFTSLTPKDNTYISTVSLTLQLPDAGSSSNSEPKVSLPSGAQYNYWFGYWATAEDFDFDLRDTTFEAGNYYYASLWITIKEGHKINTDTNYKITNAEFINAVFGDDSAQINVCFKVPKLEKITLKKPKISKLTTKKKKLTVTWKKLSSAERKKAKNIEIQISPDKNFKKDVKKKTLSSAKTSYTFKKLKPGVKYYVRIRTFTNTDNIKYISKWSAKKSKKVKK